MKSNPIKVMTVVGTRPEIIRLSRVIDRLHNSEVIEHVLVHTGQNYDYTLNEIFFEDLQVPQPDFYLKAAGENAAQTIGKILIKIDVLLEKIKPDAFLVLGDCFVQRQEGAGEGGPGLVFLMEPGEESYFVFCWRAGEESSESKDDFFFEAPGVFFKELAEVFGDLDKHGVVHEGKGLKRGV